MVEDITVRRKIVYIQGSPTWISYLTNVKNVEQNVAVVIIPGNPGAIGFYDAFISALYKQSRGVLSIFGVSHKGHHSLDAALPVAVKDDVYRNRDSHFLYTLEEQICHKMEFLHQYLRETTKLILIGHSIGAYIALELIKRLVPTERVIKGILLFPAIERIWRTPSYKFWAPFCNYLRWPLLGIAAAFSHLPTALRTSVIHFIAKVRGFSQTHSLTCAILSFLNYGTLDNMFQIGRDMRMIDDLDHKDVIEKNAEKLIFYYGESDPWVPRSFYEEMKDRFSKADIRLCDRNIKHAFVLYSSKEVAAMVWDWIEQILSFETCSQSRERGYSYDIHDSHVVDVSPLIQTEASNPKSEVDLIQIL